MIIKLIYFLFLKIEGFPQKRSLQHLIECFKDNKIDDSVASVVEDERLFSFGLAYGDVLSFRSTFQSENEKNIKTTYEERAKNLKDKMNMNRTKTDKRDT